MKTGLSSLHPVPSAVLQREDAVGHHHLIQRGSFRGIAEEVILSVVSIVLKIRVIIPTGFRLRFFQIVFFIHDLTSSIM